MKAVPIRVVCLACLLAACAGEGRRDAEVLEAQLVSEANLRIQIDACNADDNRSDVEESATQVVVKVTTDDPEGGPECGDVLSIELSEPLGDRIVIDGTTGEEVALISDE